MFHFTCETFWINRVIAVNKMVANMCTWIVVNDGTAHCKLVKVIISKMINDLSHLNIVEFNCQKYKKDMEEQRVLSKIWLNICFCVARKH